MTNAQGVTKDTTGQRTNTTVSLFFWNFKADNFIDEGLCKKCHSSCKTCSGPNPNQCVTVDEGKTIKNRGDVNQYTTTCNTSCERCKENEENFCTSCGLIPSYLDKTLGTCTPRAPAGITRSCRTMAINADGSETCHRCYGYNVIDLRDGLCYGDGAYIEIGQQCAEYDQDAISGNLILNCMKCFPHVHATLYKG